MLVYESIEKTFELQLTPLSTFQSIRIIGFCLVFPKSGEDPRSTDHLPCLFMLKIPCTT